MRTTQRNLLMVGGAALTILVIGFGFASAQEVNDTNETTNGTGDAPAWLPGKAHGDRGCPDNVAADDASAIADVSENASAL